MAEPSRNRLKKSDVDSSAYDEDCLAEDRNTPKDEIQEWINLNRSLRRHGIPSIRVLPSNEVSLSSGRYVCLDPESSQNLRTSVMSLLTEVNRKETMMQDVLQSNEQLRHEMQQVSDEADDVKAKSKDIKVMLECSRARVQELEEELSRTSTHYADDGERMKNTKAAMNVKCRQLEAKVEMQEKEIEKLQRDLLILGQEDDRRSKRQNKAFTDFQKRTSRAHSVMDQKTLDIIDSYESQIDHLQKQLDASSKDSRTEFYKSEKSGSHQGTGNFKNIIRSYEKQLRERDRQIKIMEEERDVAKLKTDSRPEMKDYRLIAQRVKKLERILSLHNISIPGEKQIKDPLANRKKFSTRLEDLDYLPLEQCHYYLKELCAELETDNLDCLINVVQEIKDDGQNGDRFQQYCVELSEIVQNIDGMNHRSHFMRHNDRDGAVSLCDANMQHFLEVVDNWRKDIAALGELQDTINQLLDKCVPWVRARMEIDHAVPEMIETLERVIHADKDERGKMMMEDVSRSTLESIVSHFQTLFDVHKVSGIYPRMNEIYKTLGEAQNVQNTLKNLLGLPPSANSSLLVDVVGKLCHTHDSTTAKQLKKLMQMDDLNGVVRRLEEHNNFFPAFHGIMNKLFEILGVDRMDEVLPAVRAIKLLAK